jgi:hypothetical protein
MSNIAVLDNRTPFAAMHAPMPDGQGGEVDLIVVKAAFDIDAEGKPVLAREPAQIRMSDEFVGDPKLGVPFADTDLALHKPKVDVLVLGARAHAPKGRPTTKLFVELHVGFPGGPESNVAAHDAHQAQLIKSLLVTGDRVWIDDAPGEPMPFLDMPLGWDRAYGGSVSERELDERNPLGIGWQGARSVDPEVLSELPNVEEPGATMVRRDSACVPAGLGVVARAWLPRRALAGTFDQGWRRRRWPRAPLDYDPAYNQSAAPDQQLDAYVGGEPVRLVNLTPEGEWLFRLPRLDVPVQLIHEDRLERPPLRVDTVEIEPEARRVSLTARVAAPISRGRGRLEQIVLGHVKPGWLRARVSGKHYVDLRGEAGSEPGRPCYW